MMVKTIAEFRDELKTLREEMKSKGEFADAKLVASWVDRLVIALEGITPTLGLMGEALSQIAEADECECSCCMDMPMKKPAKKKVSKKQVSKKLVSKKKVVKKTAMKKKAMKKSSKKRKR